MSFLPYAKPPATAWALSFGGSATLHAALAGVFLSSSVVLLPEPIKNLPSTPDFEVTLEILDADIIDPNQNDTTIEIPPDAVAVLPDDLPTTLPEPDLELALQPENQELIQPEPDTVLPTLTEPEPIPQAVVSEPISPEVITPTDTLAIDDISPITGDEVSPLAEAVAPAVSTPTDVIEIPDDDAKPQELAVLPPEPEVLQPNENLPEAVDPPTESTPEEAPLNTTEEPDSSPQTAEPTVLTNPDTGTVMIGTLLQRIRAAEGTNCAIALPRRVGQGQVGVSFVGSKRDALDRLASGVLQGLSPEPLQTREIVDPRQCALVDAVRQIADYPAGRIGVALEDTSLLSGEILSGRIGGAGGLFITLLLVDDNGVVQDLSRFTAVDGNDLVFNAPVARSGGARATRQILLALGDRETPLDLESWFGQRAEIVFAKIAADRLEKLHFGLVTFDVR